MLLSLAIKCAPYQLVSYAVSVSFVKRHLIDFVCDLKCGSFLYFEIFILQKRNCARDVTFAYWIHYSHSGRNPLFYWHSLIRIIIQVCFIFLPNYGLDNRRLLTFPAVWCQTAAITCCSAVKLVGRTLCVTIDTSSEKKRKREKEKTML